MQENITSQSSVDNQYGDGHILFVPNVPNIELVQEYSAYSAISASVSSLNIGHGLNPELREAEI